MVLIFHNIKVAIRNLMKYKLQTLIGVVSIAIGIVTLSLVHSLISGYRLPSIFYEPYYDRVYSVHFSSAIFGERAREVVRAIRKDGGPRSAEKFTVPVMNTVAIPAEFHLSDSTVRKGYVPLRLMDQGYPDFVGLRSTITGKKIGKLKQGEAIVSEEFVKNNFQGRNPIGAVQKFTLASDMPVPFTIVDVYEPVALSDYPMDNKGFYFCYGEGMEDYDCSNSFFTTSVYAVLREGFTTEELLKEINNAIRPFELSANLLKVSNDPEIKKIITIRVLSYLIGSLILLAAFISFLRIQIQLFRLRRHELALRTVNGASRTKLFGLLFTEVSITMCGAVILALFLGTMVQDFMDAKLSYFMDSSVFRVSDLWRFSLTVGGVLVIIGSLIAWVTLRQICRADEGLSFHLRHRRQRLFHHAMLGLQICIVLIVVCSTICLYRAEDRIFRTCNIPYIDDYCREYLYWQPSYATFDQLYDEIKRLPELEGIFRYGQEFMKVKEVDENPEAKGRFEFISMFNVYCTDDTASLSKLGIEVEWLSEDIDRTKCVLISDNLYSDFKELGVLDHNTLSIGESYNGFTLPVGGIIKFFPYDMQGNKLIAITPISGMFARKDQLLVPKPGKGKELARSVDETIQRITPESFDKVVFNYREKMNVMPDLIEALRTGGWILFWISLIICATSILSTISLETRGRMKEIAIRKVNGAKTGNIYRMFGKVYVILLIAAIIIAVPACILINRMIASYVAEIIPGSSLSPVTPIILGTATVTLLIAVIVGWQIHRIMSVDPAKIIAKE